MGVHEESSGLHPEVRRKLGAFYTPETVVDYMVKLIRPRNRAGLILEPSGGDGAFINGLLKGGVDVARVHVWDINPRVEGTLRDLGADVSIGDSLLDSHPGGPYDVVIGNPPYLNKQSEYIRTNRRKLAKLYDEIGASEAYTMFTYMGINRLREGGQLIFLLSDTFMTLGIHSRFRAWLLNNFTVDSITLLPADTFPDAAVHTAVLAVTKRKAKAGHLVKFVDQRVSDSGGHTVVTTRVSQQALLGLQGNMFLARPADVGLMVALDRLPKLMDHLDGGLGMYTRDNGAKLAVVSRSGVLSVKPKPGQAVIDEAELANGTWKPYHKRGGMRRWYGEAEHAVRWDDESRSGYGMPASALAGITRSGKPRAGIVLSGVSSQLAARMMTPGALWESNKAFGLFPKKPRTYSVYFFIAVLNSGTYSRIAGLLNHTVSLQVRDLKRLPMLKFTQQEVRRLHELGRNAVNAQRTGGTHLGQSEIDALAEAALARSVGVPA